MIIFASDFREFTKTHPKMVSKTFRKLSVVDGKGKKKLFIALSFLNQQNQLFNSQLQSKITSVVEKKVR